MGTVPHLFELLSLFAANMSGRGRGRGRGGRGPPSGARLLLQRSAQEAGLDSGNLRSLQDITKPKLFPDFEWHSSGGQQSHHEGDPTTTPAAPLPQKPQPPPATAQSSKRATAPNIYLINKSREIQHRFQESSFYVRPSQEVDVVRYNKRPRPLEPDVHVAESIGKTADPRYLPEELLPNKGAAATLPLTGGAGEDAGAPKRAMTLEELAAEEQRKKVSGPVNNEEGEENGELSDGAEIEEEDEEEVADYTTNYYASDDESGGGGGEDNDEAVF